MADILVTDLDDGVIARLKRRAARLNMSVVALARAAIENAAKPGPSDLTTGERLAIVERMRATSRKVFREDVPQTSSLDLIREDRDR